jgi:NAD-dependent aldehyde dehydrogenases
MNLYQEKTKYLGVFEKAEDAIQAAYLAQNELMIKYSKKDRESFISGIREVTLKNSELLAKMSFEETKMGRLDHKIIKHKLVAQLTPGTEDLATNAWSGDDGLTLVEMAPYGVIGAVTPSTNSTETIVCNSIGMIAAGNSVVFNAHPSSKKSVAYAVDMINNVIVSKGGPENLVTMVENPNRESLHTITNHPYIRLLCATGGPGIVKALLSSGKKAIGAGAGNPPVIVDNTADIKSAGKNIIEGCSFDNNLPCIAEKEVFAFADIADELIHSMLENGAYLINSRQVEQLMKIILIPQTHNNISNTKIEYTINKNWVGKDAKLILKELDIEVGDNISCIIMETNHDHPFVMTELMMPVLPIVRVKDIDEAINYAKKAEHGNRHSAHMHSKNIDNLTRFAREIDTTLFVQNGKSFAGLGFGGEGFTTFTIAGPTGEGLTSARTFTRQRRCVIAKNLSIIQNPLIK